MLSVAEPVPPRSGMPAPRESNQVRLRVGREVIGVRDLRAFAGLREVWDRLLDESDAGLFNAWEWAYPWQRRIGHRIAPWILRVDEAERPVGLLAAGLSHLWAGPRRLRRIGFLAETHVGSDHLGPVAARGREADVSVTLARALREAQGEWDVLDFLDLDEGAPFVTALQETFGAPAWRVEVRPRFVCPFEVLRPGESFEQLLAHTRRRDNYVRRRRWLERQPGFSIERATTPAETVAPLGEFFRLHARRWEGDGGSQGIRGPAVEAFHRDAVMLLAERGQVRLYSLRVRGEVVASVYGLRQGERFLYFQSGYDPAWRDRSVGLVLVGETFRDALAEGCREYDFLRGTEPYKADWVTQSRRTVAVRVYAAGGPGAWLGTQEAAGRWLRDGVKRILPAAWTEQLRRLRRRHSRI